MKIIGSAIRYFLNINTIWGFMILAAFALCVAQHYMPTTLMIPKADLPEGPQGLILEFTQTGNDPQSWMIPITQTDGELELNDAVFTEEKNTPYLTSISAAGDQFVIRWDIAKPGYYTFKGGTPLETVDTNTLIENKSLFDDEGNPIRKNVPIFVSSDPDKIDPVGSYSLLVENGRVWPSESSLQPRLGQPWIRSIEQTDTGWTIHWANMVPDSRTIYMERPTNWPLSRGHIVTLESMTSAAFNYAEKGFNIAIGLVAAMVLFLGLMRVGEDAGVVQLVARVFYPVIRFLYPSVPKDHPANGAILMNLTTTILGLGNAATPFGIKAMKELESLNPNKGVATDDEIMLLGYNTAGFALLPTTLIAVRKASGCSDPFEIIGTCMIAGATSTIVAIIMVKTLRKIPMFSYKAAAEELAKERAAHGETPLAQDTDTEGGDQ